MTDLPPIRSWLYAPGNNAKLIDRVFSAGSDAVILDLEDAVPLAEKEKARTMVSEAIKARGEGDGPVLFVRINHPDLDLVEEEIRAVVHAGVRGLRIPKMEDPAAVQRLDHLVGDAESFAGLPVGTIHFVIGIESAVGLWRAEEIASSTKRVHALNLGVADFTKDLGMTVESEDGRELLYAKSRLALASRVAGVSAPVDSVTTQIDNLDLLEREARSARALGFFGKSAIHPKQVEVINRVFTPTAKEIDRAREIVQAAATAEAEGSGAVKLANGDFVDAPIVIRAQHVIALAERLGVA